MDVDAPSSGEVNACHVDDVALALDAHWVDLLSCCRSRSVPGTPSLYSYFFELSSPNPYLAVRRSSNPRLTWH